MEAAVRECLAQAHRSLLAGGLAVGACFTDERGAVIARGRNRAYDPAGGDDRLQRTRLAHAEMNVLAGLPVEHEPTDGETLWSTQQPCSMCDAAAVFTGVRSIRWLSPDPWATGAGVDQSRSEDGVQRASLGDPRVERIAAAMFVASTIRLSGSEDHPTVSRYREDDPDGFALARKFLQLAGRHRPVADFLKTLPA